MKRWLDRAILWVSTLAASAFAIGLLCRQLDIPSGLWKVHGIETAWILISLGIPAQVGLIWRAIRLDSVLKRDEGRELARQLLQALLVHIYDECGSSISATCIGVHAWRVRGLRRRSQRMERVASFKLHTVRESGVTWTKGKGVIGRCWRDGVEVFCNLDALHDAAVEGMAKFEQLDDESRLNLSWDEFQRTKRYWAVFATPLTTNSGNVKGCVSVDCTDRDARDKIKSALGNKIVSEMFALIERAVFRHGG